MPICSYLVFPRPGAEERLAHRLESLPGCQVEPARNQEMLILLTDTESATAEEALQRQLGEESDIQCLVLTFGDIAVYREDPANECLDA